MKISFKQNQKLIYLKKEEWFNDKKESVGTVLTLFNVDEKETIKIKVNNNINSINFSVGEEIIFENIYVKTYFINSKNFIVLYGTLEKNLEEQLNEA